MSRKQPKRRAGNLVFHAMAGIFFVAIVCGVSFGVASADSEDDIERVGAFGFDTATNNATSSKGFIPASSEELEGAYVEESVLTSTSKRTIDAGLKMIDVREEEARKKAAAEEAARRERAEAENAAALARVESTQTMQGVVSGGSWEYGLPAVDWTVGQDAFVSEWTARIDSYLAGSPLAGYGYAFAQAAWDNGVDPRWSPAISNTESSKGTVCFMPCNAWGWGEGGWSDWETAIFAHVAGLAEAYGYSITPNAAAVYCPPNSAVWYSNTISEMGVI